MRSLLYQALRIRNTPPFISFLRLYSLFLVPNRATCSMFADSDRKCPKTVRNLLRTVSSVSDAAVLALLKPISINIHVQSC